MEVFGIVLVVLLFLLGIAAYSNIKARRQYYIDAAGDRNAILSAVRDSLSGSRWEDAAGPGMVNKRRRSLRRSGGLTMSVDVLPLAQSTWRVQVWASEHQRFMEMADAAAVERAQKSVLAGVASVAHVLPDASATA